MLRLTDIHKSFHHQKILRGINLEVNPGEVVVILGPSGSGKTTLLRSINFLEKADAGTIELNDLKVDAHSASKQEILQMRRRLGMVFQQYNLFHNKTALENVTLGPIMVQKVPEKEAIEKGKKFLDLVGLSDKYDFYPAQLSGGQQQRIGIARALALNPEIILFDEPTSALDPELVGEVLDVMRQVAKTGKTMIVVTHEIQFASDIASRIIFMDGGKIVEQGKPSEILYNAKEERTRQFLKRINPEYNYVI